MKQNSATSTFLQEAEDLLGQIEETALAVLPGQPAGEPINHLFRAFHTIKGSGAMFGFDAVAGFTHHVETVLDKVREGALPVSEQLVNLILAAKDRIKVLLEAAQGGPAASKSEEDNLVAELNALLGQVPACASEPPSGSAAPNIPAGSGACAQAFHVHFAPNPGLMASGTNPLMLLNELRGLGQCTVRAQLEGVPPLDQLQPDQCYLAWDLELLTDKGANAIKDVFIFVEGEAQILIEPLAGALPAAGAAPALAAGLAAAAAGSKPAQALASAAEARPGLARKGTSKDSTVRVPSERLDRLVTLVGEMVMNQSRLTQVAARADVANLTGPVEELERLVAELRDTVLGIRMMPIGTTFSRYKRLVHDLSAELGKEIELITEGAETELDKTVLDQLGDPLVHLIRNSIDHGIEPMEARQAAGKARRGTIRLAAVHTGSNVVITIEDDGHGLDPERLRAKALEKHLITPEQVLSREEIFNLIFLPGFSTAKQVTSVSGRGVGMDVVRRQLETLRGSIQLSSELGRGTTVALTLPLTLAIIDGLLVEIDSEQFIIPMAAVTENVELSRAERARNNGRNLVAVRGELVPYLRLREEFAVEGADPSTEKVVIVRQGSDRVGLVVDRVLGSHQTVIQSLGRFYHKIEVVSGATIMGDGRVALILDLAGLLRLAAQAAGRPSGASLLNPAQTTQTPAA